jgi:hypothetical protein
MGGGGGTAGGTKGGASTNSTGAPAWTSGTGNTQMAAPGNVSTVGNTSGTSTPAPGAQPPQPGQQPAATGPAPEPGSDAYNTMNTQLQTAPMQALLQMFQNGGASPEMQQIMQNLMNTNGSNAAMDQSGQMFQDLAKQAQGPGAQQQYLTDYANGSMLGKNPYVDAIANKAEQDAMSGVNQMFAAGGRYGSGMNQGTTAEAIANANNQYRGQAYEADAGRQMQAAQGISQEQLGRMGIQQQGASGLGQLGQSGMSNWLNAQQGASQIGAQNNQNLMNAFGQLGNVQNNKMFDSNQQLNVGNATTDQTQKQLTDLMNQWTQGDMQDWARTGGLLSAGTGAAGNWGTQSGTQKNTSQAGIGSILGGILALM